MAFLAYKTRFPRIVGIHVYPSSKRRFYEALRLSFRKMKGRGEDDGEGTARTGGFVYSLHRVAKIKLQFVHQAEMFA